MILFDVVAQEGTHSFGITALTMGTAIIIIMNIIHIVVVVVDVTIVVTIVAVET